MTLVAPLSAFGKDDLAVAGGKGANLGELVRSGFPVPGGFVVTTEAYTSVAGSHAAEFAGRAANADAAANPDAAADADAAADDGSAVRADIEAVEIPAQLGELIRDAYTELGGGPVAVRSSATAEDLPGAAFAGQQDTYLNVVGEDALLDAIRRCWASLWTDRAIAYRRRLGIDSTEVSIAVVVQSMVDAELAGVMFTANPVTGDRREIVVDASSGLGEAVVSGLVTPDHYVLDRDGRVREWSAGRREVVVRAVAGGGVTHDSESAAPERMPAGALEELAGLGSRVAEHFGRPQDIEWAYSGGNVRLLQARPMTALPPPPVRLNPAQRKLGSVLLEYLPIRPYPMDMSTWLPYGPAGLMGNVLATFGIKRPFDDFLQETDGVVDRLVPQSPRPSLAVLLAPFRLTARARRYDPAKWTSDPRFADYLGKLRKVDEVTAQEMTVMSWEELLRVPQQAFDLVRPVTDFRSDYLPRTGLALLRMALLLKLLGRPELRGDLMSGAPTRTEDANRALEELAACVGEDPSLKAVVDAVDVPRLKEFGDFHRRFEAFLREYGHRETVTPLLVTPPTWGESPETVLALVKVLASTSRKSSVSRAQEAMRSVLELPALRKPRSRARVRRWIEAAQAGMAFREDSHFYFTMPLPILRRAVLEMGRRLCDAAVLKQPEDVFHLRLEEVRESGDPARLAEDVKEHLRGLVRSRMAKRAELTGVRLIDPAAIYPARDHQDALVSGTPASAGRVTGPVRVIRSPDDFAKLESGDVLVCPYTNPSWTPLFQRAAAVVVDSGATASHAAIVAREYGIPAIMGSATGTTVLSDGQLVTVDGGTGRVTAAS